MIKQHLATIKTSLVVAFGAVALALAVSGAGAPLSAGKECPHDSCGEIVCGTTGCSSPCIDNPGSNRGCNMQGQVCGSYGCGA